MSKIISRVGCGKGSFFGKVLVCLTLPFVVVYVTLFR